MVFKDILDVMVKKDASDSFIRADSPLKGRVRNELKTIDEYKFNVKDIDKIVSEITDDYQRDILKKTRSCEFANSHGQRWRFRIGIFYQRDTLAMVIRKIDLNVATFEQLNLPIKVLTDFCSQLRCLILLTGVT